jgi:hypothetical protein
VFDKDLDYLNQRSGYVLKDSQEWTDDRGRFPINRIMKGLVRQGAIID